MRFLIFLLCLSAAFCTRVSIFHTTDTHSYAFPYRDPATGKKYGTYASMSTLLKERKKNNELFMVFDAGDIFQGTLADRETKGGIITRVCNDPELFYDARLIGNHDFDYGKENTREKFSTFSHTVLATNFVAKNSKDLDYTKPWAIFERGGYKFGVFGILDQDTKLHLFPSLVEGLEFEDEAKWAKKMPSFLRQQGADFVIMISHVGFYRKDGNTGEIKSQRPELLASILNQDDSSPENHINLVIDGHTHSTIFKEFEEEKNRVEDNIWFAQAGYYNETLGELLLEINDKTRVIETVEAKFHPLDAAIIKPNEEFLSRFQEDITLSTKIDGKEIARVRPGFFLKNDMDAKFQQNEAALIIVKSFHEWAKEIQKPVDISIINIHGVRNHLMSRAGKITSEFIHKICPFENTMVEYSLKGQDILDIWKHSGKHLVYYGMRMVVSKKNFEDSSLSIEPLKVEIKKENGWELLDPEKDYRIISPSYLAQTESFLIAQRKTEASDLGEIDKVPLEWFLKTITQKTQGLLSEEPFLKLKNQTLAIRD